MKVLVLGGAGYIGSVLCTYLRAQGLDVMVFDCLLYEKNSAGFSKSDFTKGDIRDIDALFSAIEKSDAVVNLAAISNDPASDLAPNITWDINYKANGLIAKLCKSSGKRVIYASSCSVYGFSKDMIFDEKSRLAPVTLYARTKMLSEEFYMDAQINAIILRFATVYGYSAKPRFDLVVNTMIGTSYFEKKIVVNGGDQWRPIVHVKDVAHAIYLALITKNPKSRVYNVGSNDQNYRIEDLADLVNSKVPQVEIIKNTNSVDARSYKVDFSRIKKELGFVAKNTVSTAIDEFYEAFKSGLLTNMEDDEYFRVKYLKRRVYPVSLKNRILNKISYRKILNLF